MPDQQIAYDTTMTSLRRGDLVLQRDNDEKPVTDGNEMRRLPGPALEKVLANLAKRALIARVNA